jgi:5-methylcytosine-specific restriction protein A
MAKIPMVSESKIKAALSIFDQKFRGDFEFQGWELNGAQKHAIFYEGRHYPPKKIVSIATGLAVGDFSGGPQTNSYLQALNFDVVPLREAPLVLPKFTAGKIYDRFSEINDVFGGNWQCGISKSKRVPAIFIFTGDSAGKYGYSDHFDEHGVFLYTGEGQIGDMTLDKGNRAIVDHSKDGLALHAFKTVKNGKGKGSRQQYLGEFTYASHEIRKGHDRDGNLRKIIVFHLVPVDLVNEDADDVLDEHDSTKITADLKHARKRALAAFSPSEEMGAAQAQRTLYRRSKAVKDYVILRSSGVCESCKNPAPFKRVDGSPYLEPHHTTRVSDGGLDHPRHVAAICPTCHREIHHGLDGHLRNSELMRYLQLIEQE